MIGWVDPEALSDQEWQDRPDGDVLTSLLEEAHEQCVAFLPHRRNDAGELEPVIPDPVPARLRRAQILQARAIQRSAVAGEGDQVGGEQGVTVWPMDWTVKRLLRPQHVGRVL